MLKKEKEKEVMRLFILLLKKTKLYQDYVSVIKSKGSLSLKGLTRRARWHSCPRKMIPTAASAR